MADTYAASSPGPFSGRRLTRARLAIAGLALAGLALVIYLAFRAPHGEDTDAADTSPAVALSKAVTRDVPRTFEAIGTVEPLVTATVRAQLSGTLVAIAVEEGQRVRKGQLLARIDPRPYTIALDQARAALQRDAAQLANAQLDLERYTRLLAQDSIAKQQVSGQEASVRQLTATLALDRAQVESARLNLGYTRLVAPVSGRVGLRGADIGDLVGPSDTGGIFTVTQEAPVDVAFTVAQENLPRLTTSPDVVVRAREQREGRTLGTGTLRALDNAVDAASGTVRAKARFANAEGSLFPGQFVTVSATTGVESNAVVVPVSAIRHNETHDFLFVVDAHQRAHVRRVRTGPMDGADIAIRAGLRAGETVVSSGADRLDEGMRVRPVDASARKAAAPRS